MQPKRYEVTALNSKTWVSSDLITPPLCLHLRPKSVLTLFWPENRFPNFIDLKIRFSTQNTKPTEISTSMYFFLHYVSSLWCREAITGIRYSHFPMLILIAYRLCMFYNAHKMFLWYLHLYYKELTKCCVLQILMNINVDVFDWHWYVTLG